MIYFRVDVSETIGWGHFKRCLALSKSLTNFTSTCFLISDPDARLCKLIERSGSKLYALPGKLSYKEEISYYPADSKNIIVDLGHRKNLEEPDAFLQYLLALKQNNFNVILLVGAEGDQFRHPEMPMVKALIQPYWCSANNLSPNAEHWLRGEEYTLLDQIYKHAYHKRKTKNLQNILVTFGGADPQNITVTALTGLGKAQSVGRLNNLNIKVIIGPSFSKQLTSNIEKIACTLENTDLIFSPDNLLDYYCWADLGICGSSTSRYEAAACGLPVIFTAIFSKHEKLSVNFSHFGTSQYLGYYKAVSANDWCKAVVQLFQNTQQYKNMVDALEERKTYNFGTDKLAKEVWGIFRTE